ncbi:MAG TPA: hypothetical protein VGM89_19950 [Puia sp.]
MINISLRKYWITLTSVFTIGATIVLACAGDWGPEYGNSAFTPQVFVDSAYSPFFYSNQFYYGINYDDDYINRWKSANITDWTNWLGKTLTPGQVGYLLDSADLATLDSVTIWLGEKPAYRPARLAGALPNPNITPFNKYLQFARRCEAFATSPIRQAWDTDTAKRKLNFDIGKVTQAMTNQFNLATDPFIKQRYWFQLTRSCFFNGNPQMAVKLFDTYNARFPHNKLWYRTLAYAAGGYYKQKQYSKANYYYSRVFDSCDELKTVAHYSFHPQEEADWQATLALCSNAEEKATLWQMLGIFYADPQRAITRIYELDPHSEKLPLLLARAVNMREQRDLLSAGAKDSLLTLVTRIAKAGNTAKPWAWQLAAGYLNTLNSNFPAAAAFFKSAESATPHDNLAQAQLRLLKILNTLAAAPRIDHSLEQKLLPDIQWLESIHGDAGIRSDYAFDWLKKTIAAKYKGSGDKVKSECFVSSPIFYTDSNNVEGLKAFLGKAGKTPYEQLCTHLSAVQYADVYEYQAVRLTLADRIDEALTTLKQVPTAATTILPANPFNARIIDCHDCDYQAAQKIKYSKLALVQKLKELKDKVAAGTDVFTNAVLFGNAEYNITYFGNARAFYETRVLSPENSLPNGIDSAFRAPLMNMNTAIKYYTLALNAAQTDEQRAKCQYLLAKCQRNDWYGRNIFSKDDYEYSYNGPNFTAWDGFKALKQYPNTQYYKEVLKECGYFRSYIHQNK